MRVDACFCSALVARHVANALSTVCCFTSRKHSQRDDFKVLRGSRLARDSATELHWGVPAAVDDRGDDDGPGSGDEDVLTSLGASYRAWRVYHREKRAHDYTKRKLVEAIRHEAALVKQLARVGGTAEGIERTLMKLEDLEVTVVSLNEKIEAAVGGQVTYEDLRLEFETLQAQCQVHNDRLYKAEAAALRWKSQCQEALPELASTNLEKDRLARQLRTVKKAAVLVMNRQYTHLDVASQASQSLLFAARHLENETKKRSYSDNEIV